MQGFSQINLNFHRKSEFLLFFDFEFLLQNSSKFSRSVTLSKINCFVLFLNKQTNKTAFVLKSANVFLKMHIGYDSDIFTPTEISELQLISLCFYLPRFILFAKDKDMTTNIINAQYIYLYDVY